MKSICVEIYHQRLYDEDADLVRHSLEFDGKELKVLGMIPHASKIIIDKKNTEILKSVLDKIMRAAYGAGAHDSKYSVAREVLAEYERMPRPGDYHGYGALKRWLRLHIEAESKAST